MQYFSFIGMGDKDRGYKEVYYSFENNPNEAILSRFVQKLIINRHEADLDEVYFFATKESRERYEDELKAQFEKKLNVYFINISIGMTYEDYTLELLKHMKENEDIILDVTHSFRYIPMKLLFALKYIELTKNVRIQHLYYGLLKKDNTGEVVDFVNDYTMQQISDLLAQFNRTLMINGEDIDAMIVQKDDKIKKFLEALSSFNKMIEYCEFDNSLNEIRKITESCSSIIKNEENYSLIIPIVKQIKDKFDLYSKSTNDINRKIELINILIQHQRMQVAITFIDQFFREELIRNTLDPLNKKFDLKAYLKSNCKSYKYESTTFYKLSQYLRIDVYRLANGNSYCKFNDLLKGKEKEIADIQRVLTSKRKNTIDIYFNEIRNHMNHGTSVQMEIKPILNDMLDCIKEIGRRNK